MASSKSRPNGKDDLQNINHFISRAEARELITRYRRGKTKLIHPELLEVDKMYGVIPESEAFNEKSILAILAQPGCVGIRIHYGMKTTWDKKTKREVPLIVAVIVGVDKEGKNIWSLPKPKAAGKAKSGASSMMLASSKGPEDARIDEDSQRCPPFPSSQPLP
jgi:hypothetical protein